MRIVAIETSGKQGSVAILLGDIDAPRLVGQTLLTAGQRSAQSLAPAIRELLAEAGWLPSSIELAVVAVGPGSFTGLRIGVTTAKVFAYATGAQVIGVNTLAAVAEQAPLSDSPIWTVMDAQRGELFVGKFNVTKTGEIKAERETYIVAQYAWLNELGSGDRVTGPALRRLAAHLPSSVAILPERFWQPTAAAVGRVGWQSYRAGQRDDVWELLPRYYRLSAAEEKAAIRRAPEI